MSAGLCNGFGVAICWDPGRAREYEFSQGNMTCFGHMKEDSKQAERWNKVPDHLSRLLKLS